MSILEEAKEYESKNELEIIRKNIKALMTQKNIKGNTALARYVNLSRDTINNVMTRNDRRPSRNTLEIIAEAFGVPYNYIVPQNESVEDLSELEIAKMAMNDRMTEEAYNDAGNTMKFQRAMIENGYGDVAAYTNLLQFMGYEIHYYSEVKSVDANKKQDVRDRYRAKKRQMENRLKELRVKIKELESLISNDTSPESTEVQEYDELKIECYELEYQLEQMKGITFEDKVVKRSIGTDESIKMLSKISKNPENLKEFALVHVIISRNDSEKTSKDISLSRFYQFCESEVKRIRKEIEVL